MTTRIYLSVSWPIDDEWRVSDTTKDRSVKEQIQNVCFHMNLPVFDEQRLSKLDQLWVTDANKGLGIENITICNPLLIK
jgi:hypothetical protein